MMSEPTTPNLSSGVNSNLRMQTAMVLFNIEEALGRYVSLNTTTVDDVPEAMQSKILERSNPQESGQTQLGRIVQATYLGELLDIALKTARLRSDKAQLERIKKLAQSLDLFEIRNAVCHPNRPFHQCYWHRVAAIATDPAIEALKLKSVTFSYFAAREGQITEPPADWINQSSIAVANNLPELFDHEITGLIGRKKELEHLSKYLGNRRFSLIAVQGPGGTGKTALVLECLRICCTEPSSAKWADKIIYLSAKTERLTTNGVESISDPLDSIEQVKLEIGRLLGEEDQTTFNDVLELNRELNLLVCIDNLETLLREHPVAFDEFISTLPVSWRVLVTTRVSVNSSTTIPLGTIEEAGAIRLARDYLIRRGGERLEDGVLRQLVTACDRNPLSIRLTIEAFLAGTELDTALKQTREQILEFSYRSLLEAIPNSAIKILECLFTIPDSVTRSEIGELLELNVDQVANGIGHLTRTSLVTRHMESVEKYSLSMSVRDLLLRSPFDPKVRQDVQAKLREQRMLVGQIESMREAGKTDPCAWDFITDKSQEYVKVLGMKSFRAIKNRSPQSSLMSLVEQVRLSIQRENSEPLLYRMLGHLLLNLQDRYGAIDAFRRAATMENWDPSAALTLAELLRDDQQHENSLLFSAKLFEEGYGDPDRCSVGSAIRINTVRWVVPIWLGRPAESILASKHWQNNESLRPTLGCIYFTARKREIEGSHVKEDVESAIEDCLECIEKIFCLDGYLPFVVHAAFNSLEEFGRAVDRVKLSKRCNLKIAQLIDSHLHSMCTGNKRHALDDDTSKKLIAIFREQDCGNEDNPLKRTRWQSTSSNNLVDESALGSYGYLKIVVYKKSSNNPCAFLFGKDSDGNEYYVHRQATGLTQRQFDQINVNDAMSVWPDLANQIPGKAINVRDAVPW